MYKYKLPFNNHELMRQLEEMLSTHNSLSIAYNDGVTTFSCALWFSHEWIEDQPLLYFLSDPNTHHGSIFRELTQVAFTIHKDDQLWNKITGIQGRGIVKEMGNKLHESYINKFPFLDQVPSTQMNQYVIVPSWIRLIDNSISFGFKKEFNY